MLSVILIHQNFAKEVAILHVVSVEAVQSILSLSVSVGTRPGEALTSCVLMLGFTKSGRPSFTRTHQGRCVFGDDSYVQHRERMERGDGEEHVHVLSQWFHDVCMCKCAAVPQMNLESQGETL